MVFLPWYVASPLREELGCSFSRGRLATGAPSLARQIIVGNMSDYSEDMSDDEFEVENIPKKKQACRTRVRSARQRCGHRGFTCLD